MVPAGVPKTIANRLYAKVGSALAVPSVTVKRGGLGCNLAGGTLEQIAVFVGKQITKWAEVVRRKGAKIERNAG